MRSVATWTCLILSLLLGLGVGGVILSQDLPPEMRADQYLLEGKRALQQDDPAAALRAFEKLEALPVAPPPEFFYWYGQALVEHGISRDDVLEVNKGEGLLKQYLLDAGRQADHYTSALEWISRAEGHGLPRPQQPAEDAGPPTASAAAPQEPVQEAKPKEAKIDRCNTRLWGEWSCGTNPLILSHSFDTRGIEKVAIAISTGIFSQDTTTYPVDEKWHSNSKTGKENAVTCGGWNKYGYRTLSILTRDAPGSRSGKYERYYVNDRDTLWVTMGNLSIDQDGSPIDTEQHNFYCKRD